MKYVLFTYGTLCLPEVMTRVTGRRFDSELAWLSGYQRYLLRGRAYPGMVYTGRSGTPGRVYYDIDPLSQRRIDAFEGDHYRRLPVTPELEDGSGVEAVAYILVDSLRYLLSDKDWDEAEFKRKYLPRYLKRSLSL